MPKLTDLELEIAARACRAFSYNERERAKAMENPGMCGPIEHTAQRAAASHRARGDTQAKLG